MKGELSVTSGPAEGTVFEVKEEPGLGVTIDAMIDNGRLEVDDQIMVAGRKGVIGTRVRALLLPKPLDEIRDPRDKFSNAKFVDAAAFFFSSRRRHTRFDCDWSSDVCSSD